MSLRMAAWYAGTSFLLVLLATSFLYWSFGERISGQEDRGLSAIAQILRPLARKTNPEAPHAIWSALGAATSGNDVRLRIIGANGRIILQSAGNVFPLPQSEQRSVHIPPASHTGAASQRFRTIANGTATFRMLTETLPGGKRIQIAIASTASQALLLRYRESLTLILVVSIILCAVLGHVIARSGMRPIERIAEAAERIRVSTLHERLDIQSLPAELASLANTFNLMLDRLEQSFIQLSQFSADLAHELRTPIGNLRGELEVALSRPRSDNTYREVLDSALEECTRITRVIQSLLFLARAEMAGQSPALENLDLAHEIATILEFYQPMAAEAGLSLTGVVPPETLIQFDRILFQQAIGNLIANAIAHTEPGGQITVTTVKTTEQVNIQVQDTGQGIAPEHLPYIFSRFYRADRARSYVGGNLGLGLAVVRAIMDLHNGQVTIESQPGEGATVTLHVPAPGRGTVSPV